MSTWLITAMSDDFSQLYNEFKNSEDLFSFNNKVTIKIWTHSFYWIPQLKPSEQKHAVLIIEEKLDFIEKAAPFTEKSFYTNKMFTDIIASVKKFIEQRTPVAHKMYKMQIQFEKGIAPDTYAYPVEDTTYAYYGAYKNAIGYCDTKEELARNLVYSGK